MMGGMWYVGLQRLRGSVTPAYMYLTLASAKRGVTPLPNYRDISNRRVLRRRLSPAPSRPTPSLARVQPPQPPSKQQAPPSSSVHRRRRVFIQPAFLDSAHFASGSSNPGEGPTVATASSKGPAFVSRGPRLDGSLGWFFPGVRIPAFEPVVLSASTGGSGANSYASTHAAAWLGFIHGHWGLDRSTGESSQQRLRI